MIPPQARRILLTAGAAIVFLLLLGATYQGVATALERRQFPHPGNLVDIGDRQLHLHCTGSGSPVVVLEAPAAGLSAAWGWVQPPVSAVTRVCSYDRAGLGWSEMGNPQFNAAEVPDHLHALLERAGEPGPFVVVGHGLGAAFASLYAARFPSEVAGLVLIDAPAAGDANGIDRRAGLVRASPWLARAGILRMTRMLARRAQGLPDASADVVRMFLNRPDHLTRAGRELEEWETVVRLAEAPIDPAQPVVRVEATGDNRVAFLTDERQAAHVVETIQTMVREARLTRARLANP